MKTISIAVLLSVALAFSAAEDDGQYHPELNGGDDGQYHDAKYYNGKYASIYSTFQPTYAQALQRELLAPYIKYGDSVDLDPFASALSTVTYRPVTSTYSPFYSTSSPVVYSTPSPVVYSTPSPVVYSTPSPAVYSTPSPIVYSTPSPAVYSSTVRPFVYSSPSVLASPAVAVRTLYNTDKDANIVRQESDTDLNGYHYAYQSDNGIAAAEQGDASSGGTRVSGFYEYLGPDGVTYRVDYTADENGFRPVGRHIPVLGAK